WGRHHAREHAAPGKSLEGRRRESGGEAIRPRFSRPVHRNRLSKARFLDQRDRQVDLLLVYRFLCFCVLFQRPVQGQYLIARDGDCSLVDNDIIIVSGLPRSGTSLLMQMLDRGGLQVVTDNIRTADTDNPRGYYEYEQVKKIKQDASWLP